MSGWTGTLHTVQVHFVPVRDIAEIESEWRALEARVPTLSFFQSWVWVGCLAAERFPHPVMLRAEREGQTVGLALFNRYRRRLHLTSSGIAALDAPFVEYNAPLAMGPDISAALLRAAWKARGIGKLVLDGSDAATVAGAGGVPWRMQRRIAPRVVLGAIRAAGLDYIGSRSGNTRYQLRRSLRAYERRGVVTLERAARPAEALDWLSAMIALHEARWQAQGSPGAFASDYLLRFHRTLVVRALAEDMLDMNRVRAGGDTLGYLYNFRLRGHVYAYQSGFSASMGHEKPGLTCHALAIQHALTAGDEVYDFLGGNDRYKRSLANAENSLLWAELVPALSPAGIAARLGAMWGWRPDHAVSISR
ncbi:hypothetical protein HMPREF9946_04811 [Acetobacteraceae bacterium AT-5844]|nr:hypothetical protein HMPREF9946_04811 [Acetobacteraceae bacterium AT-5844]